MPWDFGVLQKLGDQLNRGRNDQQAITPLPGGEMLADFSRGPCENAFFRINNGGGLARRHNLFGQPLDNPVDQHLLDIGDDLGNVMNANRTRIFRNAQIINTGGFAGGTCQRRKAGSGNNNAGNTRFFYVRGRPRRSRCTGPSGPVARHDGIAPLFPGQ